jgi:hypothetical protein
MKEFIPFEEAVELKHLGFHYDCFSYLMHDETQGPIGLYYCYDHPEDLYVLQPTFSQAFRFFREKYDLQYWLRDGGYLGKCFIQITVYKHDKIYFLSSEAMEYEEAELQCLRLLIKIAKESI